MLPGRPHPEGFFSWPATLIIQLRAGLVAAARRDSAIAGRTTPVNVSIGWIRRKV